MMILDIHTHTSNRPLSGLHTRTATLDDLDYSAVEYNILYTVLLATYFPFKGSGLHNQELLERIKNRHQFKFFGSLDVMNNFENGLEELRNLAQMKWLSGIKLYPGYQNFDPSHPGSFGIYQLAEQFNLPVMIHTGELHHCCPKELRAKGQSKCGNVCWIDKLGYLAKPKQMEGAIRAFPKVNFILAHLGNPYFEQTRELMRRYPNVFTDTSGQFVSGTEEDTPEYRAFLKAEMSKFLAIPNGINRFLFGTDFPIQSYADSIALIKALELPLDQEDKIFFRNAAKLLKIVG